MKDYGKLLEERFRKHRLDLVRSKDLDYIKSMNIVLSIIDEMLKEKEPLFEAEIAVNLQYFLDKKINDEHRKGFPLPQREKFYEYTRPFFNLIENNEYGIKRVTLEKAIQMAYEYSDKPIKLKSSKLNDESLIRPSHKSALFFEDDKRLTDYIKKHTKIEEIVLANFNP